MTYQKAQYEDKRAPLHSEFGEQFVLKRFGELAGRAILDAMPLYKRGPHKGLRKGYVQWMKVPVGGWTSGGIPRSVGGAARGVLRPGTQWVRVTLEWDRDARAMCEGSRCSAYSEETWAEECRRGVQSLCGEKV